MSDQDCKHEAGATDVGGLTSAEAAGRLGQWGPNTVIRQSSSMRLMLLLKFWGLIPWMLEIAIIADLALGRWVDAVVIAVLLVFNALIGFMQEKRSQQALALLRGRLTVNARVQRDGRWQTLAAAQLVPGDRVRVRIGDIVPADLRLTEGALRVDQSVLTGESTQLDLGDGATAYSGSTVTRGEASAEVMATGAHTFYGQTTELVRVAQAPPRLEGLVVQVAKYLGAFDVALAGLVLAVALMRGAALSEVLPFMLMLLVLAIPHVLPTMFTMTAALGARGLADQGILVTRLAAIEDAASMDILCLDKTGTLTENRLAVESAIPLALSSADELLRLAALASDAATQDPIDLALLEAARARGLPGGAAERLASLPFDPATKRAEVSIRQGDAVLRIVKGEPVTLAALANEPWANIAGEVARLAADGARVLAVALDDGVGLRMAGLVSLSDPPRADSAALVKELGKRGVRVMLVTGDGEATALAVAAKVGITGAVAPAGTIRDQLTPETAASFAIFARVLPQDKFRLVRALQQGGHVVGMTGDGVNDAPALRQADVGVAVANATDVAKAASSLVLTRPGLSELIMAIEGSRRIYQRMKTFLLAMNTRKIALPLLLSLGVVLLDSFVLSPLLMVLFMLSADVVTMSVSMDQVTPSPGPDRWDIRPLMRTALGLGTLLILMSALVFWCGTRMLGFGMARTQTLVFIWLVFAASQAVVYLSRSRGRLWSKPYPARPVVVATVLNLGGFSLMAAMGWLMAPMPLPTICGEMVLALIFLFGADGIKSLLARSRPPTPEVIAAPVR